jgi:Serine/threonine protein kinase
MMENIPGGRYEPVRALGASGRTWLARDTVLHRDVAITTIPLPPGPPEARDHALADARIAAGLSHPALVTVHDVLVEPTQARIVTDFVQGRSLSRIVGEEGPLRPGRVAQIGLSLLDALAAIHGRGTTHRMVSPDTVLVADTGEVMLAGLGTAPAPGPYADPGADLRALGATLLFAAEARDPSTGPPGPGPLAHPIHALMYGPPDPQAVRAALTAVATAEQEPATVPSGQAPGAGRSASGAVVLAACAVLVVALIVAAFVVLRPGRNTPNPTDSLAAGATPGTGATASPTPSPSASRAPDPCELISADYRPPLEPANTCTVRLGEANVTVKTHPDEATAKTIFAAVRKRQAASAGSSSIEGSMRTKIRDVPLGDEAFSQEYSVELFPGAGSLVWLRIDAWTVEISVTNMQTKVTQDMRTAAMSAARTVATALTRRS